MTYQRRRGIPVKIWPIVKKTDDRGNQHLVPDLTSDPITSRAWLYPQRSGKAEVPGQQKINVVRLGLTADLSDALLVPVADMYGQVEYMGRMWDVVAPPAYHHGSNRATRHWSIDVRERP